MRYDVTVLALCLGTTALAQDSLPNFTPRALPAHQYTGGWEHFVGGGLAVFDCDGDLLPDLYAAGGSSPAQLMRNKTGADGTLTFAAETPEALALTGVIGAYPLDIDSDGLPDLMVLRDGPDQILRGLGNCQFEPFDDLGFDGGGSWSTAFSATWEAGQTLPTLAIGTYVDRSDPAGPFGTCDATLLYRPEGNSYGLAQRLEPGFCALSMLFSDWSRSGRADLRVSNDRHYYLRGGQEQMWAMEVPPRLYSAEDGWRPYHLWGMGIASRDLTGDGYADVMLTSMGDQKLQYFDGDGARPSYKDATYERGTTAHRPYTGGDGRPSTGWHAAFGDVNNDGLDDLFIAKGNVEQMPVAAMEDPNNLLLQQSDGRFAEVGDQVGVAGLDRSRGAALVDLNRDGALDLAVINRRAEMELYQNASANSYLSIELARDGANRDAIGAHVELRADGKSWVQERTIGGGHAGGALSPLHFGLGDLDRVELRVIWPDQTASNWVEVTTRQALVLSGGETLTVTPR